MMPSILKHVVACSLAAALSCLLTLLLLAPSPEQQLQPRALRLGRLEYASIVVMVTNKADSTDRRTWLRRQFQRNVELLRQRDPVAAEAVVLKFVIGTMGLSDDSYYTTRAEQQEHGDILALDIIDTDAPDPPADNKNSATSLKVAYSIAWAVKHYTFPWLVRLGDDSYFRVDHFLLNVAPTLDRQRLVLARTGKATPQAAALTPITYITLHVG